MTAPADLDAVDLTALVEHAASRSYDRWRGDMAQQWPHAPARPAWDELEPLQRHSHREMHTPIVADVLTGLRAQARGAA